MVVVLIASATSVGVLVLVVVLIASALTTERPRGIDTPATEVLARGIMAGHDHKPIKTSCDTFAHVIVSATIDQDIHDLARIDQT